MAKQIKEQEHNTECAATIKKKLEHNSRRWQKRHRASHGFLEGGRGEPREEVRLQSSCCTAIIKSKGKQMDTIE